MAKSSSISSNEGKTVKRSWKVKLSIEQLNKIAAEADILYANNIADGFELMPSSGIWRTRGRGVTARFVYRPRLHRDGITRTTVIRGI